MPRYIALDLETVPDEDLVSAVDGEPGRSYGEQVQRLLAARKAQSGGRSDFLPLPYHRPVAACTVEATEDAGALLVTGIGCWTDRHEAEPEFLARFWKQLRGRTLVSFHGRGFDLPVLELRSLKLGVSAPSWFNGGRQAGPDEHQDLFELLSNSGAAPAAPLDLYAKLVGLPGKADVAGKDVRALYADGEIDRIAAYCMTDVVQTWLLYLRFRLLEGSITPTAYQRSLRSSREALPALFADRLAPGVRALLGGFLDRCSPFLEDGSPVPLRKAL